MQSHSWSLVVTRGLLEVTRGHSWSLVVTRGHSCVLLDTIHFDALSDLRDTRLALLCLICKASDVSVNHLHCIVKTGVYHQMYVSCIHKIVVRNRFELAVINTTEIVLQLYLFPL